MEDQMQNSSVEQTEQTIQNEVAVAAETIQAAEPTAQTEVSEEVQTPSAPEENFVEPEEDFSSFTREQIVERMTTLVEEDVTHIRNRVSQLRQLFDTMTRAHHKSLYDEFIAGGGNKDEYQQPEDSVADAFRKLYGVFRQKRQKYLDDLEAQKLSNLTKKQQLLDSLKKLIESDEPLKKTYDEFNAVQDAWKAIGDVPRAEVNNLWQNYHFLVEQFFNKVKINKELRMLDLKRNLEQKILLCEKTEELIMEPSISKAHKQLMNYREQWRGIGPVPSEQNDDIWTRFCNAADQIEGRRREYNEQRQGELEKNLLAKQALIEKATELTSRNPQGIKEWNDISAELEELLKVWKTIGPVPREQNDEIWNQFKSMLDKFFALKKDYFEHMKDSQNENYNKKIDLCLQAEAIAKREDWKKATEDLLKLQEEWKQIGSVSRKLSDKIWARFRAACDEFFNKKSEYYNNIRGSEDENLAKKEAIIAQLKEFQFGEDKEENLRVIKDFQRQWMEIGFVPISQKERLKKEFRAAINAHFDRLKITARETEENAFRERIRNAGGDVAKFAADQKTSILNAIEKHRNEINLLENNMGFLANSKQADLLKDEFNRKIQSARQQIALLEAKLRILSETKEQGNAEEKPQTEE